MVGTTSEPLLPEIRAAVAETWGAPLFNGFGTTEGLMGGSCSAGRGMHLSDDLFVIEPVDAQGDPVPPGERAAKVYLTNLYNRVQPLIRYELTDEITVLDGPCPCGVDATAHRRHPGPPRRLLHVPRRARPCTPSRSARSLGRERDIVEYQVRQTARGADIQVCCHGPSTPPASRRRIRAALVDHGLAGAEVSITPVETLGRQDSGKLRRFVPLARGG